MAWSETGLRTTSAHPSISTAASSICESPPTCCLHSLRLDNADKHIHASSAYGPVALVRSDDMSHYCTEARTALPVAVGVGGFVQESGTWFKAPVATMGSMVWKVPIFPLCENRIPGTNVTYGLSIPANASSAGIEWSMNACADYCRSHTSSVASRNATATCRLATIYSQQENEQARVACGDHVCWLGLRQHKGSKGSFLWADGTSLTFQNWDQPPPQKSTVKVLVNADYWLDEKGANVAFMNVPGGEAFEICDKANVCNLVKTVTLMVQMVTLIVGLNGILLGNRLLLGILKYVFALTNIGKPTVSPILRCWCSVLALFGPMIF